MESNNNDYGKIIRNVGLLLGIPFLVIVALYLFMNSRATVDKLCIPILSAILRTTRSKNIPLIWETARSL